MKAKEETMEIELKEETTETAIDNDYKDQRPKPTRETQDLEQSKRDRMELR